MSTNQNTVYAFYVLHENVRDVHAVMCDEDGKFITAQICSGPYWAKKDLYDDERSHKWFCEQRYPEGFVVEWLGERTPDNWDGQREHTDESVKPWHDARKEKNEQER